MARAFLGPVKYLVSGAVCVGILAYAAPVLVPLLPLSGMNGELLNSMVNGHPLDRMEDGSARYPLLFRDFLRNNQTITKGLAQENQDWPAVINGDNIDAFQDMMRKSKEEAEMRQNAVEDAKAEKDGKISRKLEKCLDKGKKSPQQCEADAEDARMGNNPAIRRMKMMGPVPTEDDMYNHELDHDCALLARRLKGETGDGDWMGAPRDSSVEDYEPDLLSGSSGCDVALFKAMTVLTRHLR